MHRTHQHSEWAIFDPVVVHQASTRNIGYTMSSNTFDYSGKENLEIMEDAVNYNQFLEDAVCRHAPDDGVVLDFGAGIGTYTRRMIDRGLNVVGIELDDHQRQVLLASDIDAHQSLDSITDASIDFIYSLNVLEHIEDDREVVKEFHRVLKPGAKALIYVPAFPILFSAMDRQVGHVRRYRKNRLIEPFVRAGFTIRRASYEDFLGFFASLVFKYLSSSEPRPLNPGMVVFYDRFVFPSSKLLSRIFGGLMGKNLLLVVEKPDS